jgi:hypothetical protein
MKINMIFLTTLAVVAISCSFGGQGQFQEQYVTPSAGYSTPAPSTSQSPLQYSQFYTTPFGPAPTNPIGAPQLIDITGYIPSTLYIGEQMQAVPYSQYRSNPAYTGANSLWIKGSTAWTQYALVPLGSTLSLLAISPTGGNGLLTFADSNGQTYNQNYFFYHDSLLSFYASTIGRHTLSFAINGQSSNQVVIDVAAGAYNQPSNYPSYTNYPIYYPRYYYPWNYYPLYYYPLYYSCGSGYHLENGACVPNQPQCGAGYHLENGACVPNQVQCKAGSLLENGSCVPNQVQCKAGSHPENGACVPNQVQCKAGSHPENGACVPNQVQCKAGSHPENGACVPNQVQCGAGYHLEKGVCVPNQASTIEIPGANQGRVIGRGNQGGISNTAPIQISNKVNVPVSTSHVNAPMPPQKQPNEPIASSNQVKISVPPSNHVNIPVPTSYHVNMPVPTSYHVNVPMTTPSTVHVPQTKRLQNQKGNITSRI